MKVEGRLGEGKLERRVKAEEEKKNTGVCQQDSGMGGERARTIIHGSDDNDGLLT